MKRHVSIISSNKTPFLIILLFASFLLSGCIFNGDSPQRANDYTEETWQRAVTTNTSSWTKGADRWFFTGEPNGTEQINRRAPDSAGMTTTVVRVSDFTGIKTDGAYQLQVFGTDQANSVYIYGPNAGVNAISVSVQGDTLYVRQTNKEVPNSVMDGVIVRIGIQNLQKFIQKGCGSVEIIRIQTNKLEVMATSTSSGNIYLVGNMNLTRLVQNGSGMITVLGVNSPDLVIRTKGSGTVNLKGNIGIRSIVHHGQSDINIVGANSNKLDVNADGLGKIGIQGIVKVGCINAKDDVCVFIYNVRSECIEANLAGNARVGLKGFTKDLYVNTINKSVFLGRYLCAENAYVTACNDSHINVTACRKAFASAANQASIYFYGPAAILTEFTKDNGSVVVMGNQTWCSYGSEYRPYSYTYAHKGEAIAVYQQVDLSWRPARYKMPKSRAQNYIK